MKFDIYAIGVLVTLALYFIVGNYQGKGIKKVEDYYVSGRNAPTILIVGTLVASWTSSAAFIGDIGMSYDGYMTTLLWMMMLLSSGYILGVFLFGRYMRRSEMLTVSEFYEKRFNSKKLRRLVGVLVIVSVFPYLLEATQGCTIVLGELIGVDHTTALIIVFVIYGIFTIWSGSKGVILTDTMMFFVLMIAIFLAFPYALENAGGWEQVLVKLTEDTQYVGKGIMSWTGKVGAYDKWPGKFDALFWGISMGLAWGMSGLCAPWQTSRYLMAKNEHVAIRAGVIAAACVLVSYLFQMLLGGLGNAINPNIEDSEKVFIWMSYNVFPTIVGVVALAGILAAGMSSASTFLSLGAMSLVADVMQDKVKSEKQVLNITRIAALVLGLASVVVCYFNPPAIIWMSNFAGTLFASAMGPICLFTVWSEWITEKGTTWGIIAGFFGNIIPKYFQEFQGVYIPAWADPFIIGSLCSIIVAIVVSKFTPVCVEGIEFRRKLFVAPAEFYSNKKDIKITMKVIKIVIAIMVLVMVLMLVFYGIPYYKLVWA